MSEPASANAPEASPDPVWHRLHPASPLFLIGAQIRSLVFPAIVYLFAGEGSPVRFLILLFVIPTAIQPILHYFFYRYSLGPSRMVVREGALFRNERRIPYSRIQNVDLAQNPLHRLAGVAVVRLETASGGKPEAVMRVLSLDALEQLRAAVDRASEDARVEADRPEPRGEQATGVEAARESELLRLPPPELVRLGLVSNQGLVVVAGAIALFFQQGFIDWENVEWQDLPWAAWVPDLVTRVEAVASGGFLLGLLLAIAFGAIALVALYLLSIALAFLRFYGFRLTRRGELLRAEMGLFTRVAQTTPRRRIQHLWTHRGPIHRLMSRSSIRIDTAGGGGSDGAGGNPGAAASRQWLAPLIEEGLSHDLVREALPDVDPDGEEWHAIAHRAWKRRFRVGLVTWSILFGGLALISPWALVGILAAIPVQLLLARRYVACRSFSTTPQGLLWRSGWWRRRLSIVPFAKIQAVVLSQSPFDRRQSMARVRIDTAGASRAGHAIDIGYLEVETARRLARFLHREAAGRDFQWG